MGAEEPAAVTIASAQQAAVFADNVQYQFRTENSSGQVSMIFPLLWWGGACFTGVRKGSGQTMDSKCIYFMSPGSIFNLL